MHRRGVFRFGTKALSAEHQNNPGDWVRTVPGSPSGNEKKGLYARRLVVSAGLTPSPSFRISKARRHWEAQYSVRKTSCKTETPFAMEHSHYTGDGKSTWDVVYTYAAAGVKLNWVIGCEF